MVLKKLKLHAKYDYNDNKQIFEQFKCKTWVQWQWTHSQASLSVRHRYNDNKQ